MATVTIQLSSCTVTPRHIPHCRIVLLAHILAIMFCYLHIYSAAIPVYSYALLSMFEPLDTRDSYMPIEAGLTRGSGYTYSTNIDKRVGMSPK